MPDLHKDLKATPFGDSLSAHEADELLSHASLQTIPRGGFLCRAGDRDRKLHLVLEGTLEVVLGHPDRGTVVTSLGAGQLIGEVELMTGSLRVASLRARDEARLLELGGDEFEKMLDAGSSVAIKLIRTMAKTLARRLAAVNQQIIARSPAPPPEEVPEEQSAEEVELSEQELMEVEVDDEDLGVLDKLWS